MSWFFFFSVTWVFRAGSVVGTAWRGRDPSVVFSFGPLHVVVGCRWGGGPVPGTIGPLVRCALGLVGVMYSIIWGDFGLVSWGCYAWLGGILGLGRDLCVVVMVQAVHRLWDCLNHWHVLVSAVFWVFGALWLFDGLCCCSGVCVCRFYQSWGLFSVMWSIFLGVCFGFLVCVTVYDAGGYWSAFCPLARVVSGLGPLVSVIFEAMCDASGASVGFSFSGWCLLQFWSGLGD